MNGNTIGNEYLHSQHPELSEMYILRRYESSLESEEALKVFDM